MPFRGLPRRIARRLVFILAVALISTFITAVLIRLAPGYGVDEQELDSRLNHQSIQSLRESRLRDSNIFSAYVRYLNRLFHGDLGTSQSLKRPITQLLADRLPVTLQSISFGLAGGWMLGFALALPAVLQRNSIYDFASTTVSSFFLCIPSAVLALIFFLVSGWVPIVIALVIFPRVFRYVRNLLLQAYALPHIITAKAKGLGASRILLWHALPWAAPQLLALLGVSVSMAIGATIPVEAMGDSPGVGQLAWQAAMARDLPLLLNLTLLVTMVTLLANSLGDAPASRIQEAAA